MLVVVMILMVIATVAVAFNRRDALSGYMCGLCFSFVLMFSGVLTYIAKMTGYNKGQRVFLFLLPDIQSWLQYLPIPLKNIGYVVAIGRCLFPCFLLMIALKCSMVPWVRQHYKTLQIVTVSIQVLLLIYYYPSVFHMVVGTRYEMLALLRSVALVIIGAYIVAALCLLLVEYFSITIPFFRRSFRYVVLSNISITVLYGMYAIQDPGQIYNMYISEYLRIGSLNYITSALKGYGWIGMGLCTAFFVLLGPINLIRYSYISLKETEEDIKLQHKVNIACNGTTVFVHGMKNQLLANRVLLKRICQETESSAEITPQMKENLKNLQENNEQLIVHVEDLYHTAKTQSIYLTRSNLHAIAEEACRCFHKKYPNGKVEVHIDATLEVLADKRYFSEVLYNLLINGWEATLAAGRTTPLQMNSNNERLYTVVEIKDFGTGIAYAEQRKVFEPFYTSKNTNYNWGMGLYYVQQIVKSHFGMVRVESTPETGTSFYALLPRYSPRKDAARVQNAVGTIGGETL